jgi:hypothetical protein
MVRHEAPIPGPMSSLRTAVLANIQTQMLYPIRWLSMYANRNADLHTLFHGLEFEEAPHVFAAGVLDNCLRGRFGLGELRRSFPVSGMNSGANSRHRWDTPALW